MDKIKACRPDGTRLAGRDQRLPTIAQATKTKKAVSFEETAFFSI
jgi:hypothetical protein